MPKPLPDIPERFIASTAQSLDVAAATETLWVSARPAGEVRLLLKVNQLEALYESVYLRMFSAWEKALEDLVVYYMAGYVAPGYVPVGVGSKKFTTLKSAKAALYNNADFLLWHNPKTVIARVETVLVGSPVQTVLEGAKAEIERYPAVRHRVAHDSPDAKKKFATAAKKIAGGTYRSAGKMLRTPDTSDALNQKKWLAVIRERLVVLVEEMAQ